jgi:hypothetical protein
MTYFHPSDIKNKDIFSLIVHLDGSITLKQKDIVINFQDLDMVKLLQQKEILEDILLFDESYDFTYEMRKGKRYVIYNIPKVKKFKNFKKDDKKV